MTAATRLRAPFADTCAADLTLSLTAAPTEPLARHDHRVGDLTISLRLLGASHQVVVAGTGMDVGDFCETLACLPGVPPDLPREFSDDDYRFTSRVAALDGDDFVVAVARLTDQVNALAAEGRAAIVGAYPGDDRAVTALVADVDVCGTRAARRTSATRLTWRTWHTYPQRGEVVNTIGSLRLPGDPLTGSAS